MANSKAVATVDLSPFTGNGEDSKSLEAAHALVDVLHNYGFVKVTGHGISKQEIHEALGWVKKLFDLPYSEKMKAPHPPGPIPHRGYSGIGQEKVYSQAAMEAHNSSEDFGDTIRKITDFKVFHRFPYTYLLLTLYTDASNLVGKL
jgi:isopenicillin N synthase-like dioxygenase